MMYNKRVQDYFFSPKHVGRVDLNHHFTVVSRSLQPGQPSIELYLQCNQNKIVVQACFKTNGNPYMIASLEWICRQVEGKSFASMPQIDYQLIVNELGIPVAHYPIALRVIDVYQEALLLMNKEHARSYER